MPSTPDPNGTQLGGRYDAIELRSVNPSVSSIKWSTAAVVTVLLMLAMCMRSLAPIARQVHRCPDVLVVTAAIILFRVVNDRYLRSSGPKESERRSGSARIRSARSIRLRLILRLFFARQQHAY